MQITGPLKVWREEVGRRFLNLDFKPASEDPFRLSLDLIFREDGVGVGRTRHSAGPRFATGNWFRRMGRRRYHC